MKNLSYFFLSLGLILLSSCSDENSNNQEIILAKHIKNYTQQPISITAPIEVLLKEKLPQYNDNQTLPSDFIKIKPEVKGELMIENGQRIRFVPSQHLAPATSYTVQLQLNELMENLPKAEHVFEFEVATITPDFKIQLQSLQSYDADWQYITAEIEASDMLSLPKLKKSIRAKQQDQALPIRFLTTQDASYFELVIDSIFREKEDSEVVISWDGKSVGATTQGKESFPIAGKDNFSIVNVTTSQANQGFLAINFSESLQPDQDFLGLVQLGEDTNLRFEVNGNVLQVYPTTPPTSSVELKVFEGIQAEFGNVLKKQFTQTIRFQQLNPQVRLVSKGVILPNSSTNPFYFETVNLAAVDVRVIQIYENNVLQFLQEQNLSSTNSYNLRDVGRLVAKKTIALPTKNALSSGDWQAHAIDLSSLFEASPGAIYQVEFSFRKAYSLYQCGEEAAATPQEIAELAASFEAATEDEYWDKEAWDFRSTTYNWRERDNPCHEAYFNEDHFTSSNMLASNLGLLVKKTEKNSYFVATTHLLTAAPHPQTKVDFYNLQQQKVGSVVTNSMGIAEIEIPQKAFFAIAENKNEFAYLKLENSNALNLSSFEVEGKKINQGIHAFLYTDRGVYRPGENIFFNFVLDDTANPLPKNHPVKLHFYDPQGRLTHTEVQHTSVHQFYHFSIPTQAEDATGNWRAVVQVGAVDFTKYIPLATVKPNRLKIQLNTTETPQKLNNKIDLTLAAEWLTGAVAKNLAAVVEAKLSAQNYSFKGLETYHFSDPTRSFYPQEIPVFDNQINQTGEASFSAPVNFNKLPPGMLKADFLTKVFEGGGDFSMDVNQQWYAPFTHFVGIKAITAHENLRFETDQATRFEVVSTDYQGKIASSRKLTVYVHQIEWRWWWNRGEDQLSRYEDAEVNKLYKKIELTTDAQGKAQFQLNIPQEDRGRFLVRVVDKQSQHATGEVVYFFKDWWNMQQTSKEHNLVFTTDKKIYQVGETALINFPSMNQGKALLSVENGTAIIHHEWVEAKKGMTQVSLPITEAMAPHAFVSISLLQPHQTTKNDLPIRLFGVLPIAVENTHRKLQPQLQLPESIRPETSYTVEVSEKNGKEMTYTIAIVDEGLLDLTRFTTPAIYDYFNAKQSLGVRTFDVFDEVIGAYGGSIKNIYQVGGGDAAAGKKNRKADRFKPVVTHLGPFRLEAGKKAQHQLFMPNYIGSVKAMLVAGNTSQQSYGSTDRVMKVKQPLMLLTSVPRKLTPGEKVRLPVTVFVMDKQLKYIEVSVKNHDDLQLIGNAKQQLQVDEIGEYMVYFDFEVGEKLAPQRIRIQATAGKETAYNEVEVDVLNPNPISSKAQQLELQGQEEKTVQLQAFGTPGTNAARVSFSAFPPMNLEKRLHYLTSYPHGCVEQVTSKVFPQIYLATMVELPSSQQNELKSQINESIQRLTKYQTISGGIAYWQGGEPNSWTSNYVGHFMLEAKAQGYALPFGFINKWKSFQKEKARKWVSSPSENDLVQAYRLFTLALAKEAEVAAMNRLKNKSNLSKEATTRLALAYALVGQESTANSLLSVAEQIPADKNYDYYTYGSSLRDLAMQLETYVYLKNDRMEKMAEEVALLLSSDTWLHTHETAYALLSMAKYIAYKGGKELDFNFQVNGKNTQVKTAKGIYQTQLTADFAKEIQLKVQNNKQGSLFVNVLQSGQLPVGKEETSSKNLKLTTRFLDVNKEPMAVEKVQQGTEITLQIKIENESNTAINEVALQQFIPSGWEIIDTQFTDYQSGDFKNATHVELRDNRAYIYFDLGARKATYFEIKVNATYLGKYYLPGTQVEAMYSGNHFARNQGKWVEVF